MALIMWYPLDADVKDISGNQRNGMNNGVSFVTGKVDNAGDFERTNKDHFVTPSFSFSSSISVLSWSFWIYYDGVDNEIFFGENVQDSVNGYILLNCLNNDIYYEYGTGSGIANRKGANFFSGFTNVWVHCVIIADYTNGTITFYRNGVLLTQNTGITMVFPSTSRAKYIGNYNPTSVNAFDGQLDDLRVYDHVLSTDEIAAIYSGTEYVIDGFSYFPEFRDGEITQTALYRIRHARLVLSDDASDTITNRLDNAQHVYIYNAFKLVFSGKIENFNFTESKEITLQIQDFSVHLAEDFITYAASAETASSIVTNLLSTYGNNIFTTNITATTRTYTKTWRALSPLEIIQELALNEGYTFFVTQFKVFNFVPQNYNDLGVTLTDGTTIFKRSFPHDATKLKNTIVVIGKGATKTAGVKVIARDPASVEKYGKRVLRIEDTSIDTEDSAIERAESELNRLANPLVIGNVLIARNFTYTAGSIIQITLPQRSWVAKNFLIVEGVHELETPLSELTLGEINILNSDQLADLLMKQRLTAKNWDDDAVSVTSIERWTELISVEAYLTVERQTTISRDWNESEWNGGDDWDASPGAWSALLSDIKMVITTNGLNRIRDLVVGKAVTDLAAANANTAIGTGTTPANIADTALVTESYRASMDSGYPRDGTVDGEDEFQSSWSDSEFASGTFSELGLLDNSSGGVLIARVVPSSTFAKAAGENLRARTKLKFLQS